MPSWALKIVYNYEWIYYIVTYYHTKVELEKMHEKVKFACEYLSSLCASVSFHVLISLSCFHRVQVFVKTQNLHDAIILYDLM